MLLLWKRSLAYARDDKGTFEMTGVRHSEEQAPIVIPNAVRNLYQYNTGDVMKGNYYVYILTNWNNRVMYIGVTNNLQRRISEHKSKLIDGFTKKYNVTKLVYYEYQTDINRAIEREKEIKAWRRSKKDALVITMNPNWDDLSKEWEN